MTHYRHREEKLSQDEEFRALFREAVLLVLELQRDSPWKIKSRAGDFLARVQDFKERADRLSWCYKMPGSDCPHEEPERIRRISGNGWTFVWRCKACNAHLKPNWEELNPAGKVKRDVDPLPGV